MIVDNIFTLPDGRKVVTGHSLWTDELILHVDDILISDSLKWKIVAIERIFQGCFGAPKNREHILILEGIDHNDLPQIGINLNKGK